MYAMQKLLWDVRRQPSLAQRFLAEPDAVLDEYGLAGAAREAMRTLDWRSLYDGGANPYLLYFCALQLAVPREEYYARLREERQ